MISQYITSILCVCMCSSCILHIKLIYIYFTLGYWFLAIHAHTLMTWGAFPHCMSCVYAVYRNVRNFITSANKFKTIKIKKKIKNKFDRCKYLQLKLSKCWRPHVYAEVLKFLFMLIFCKKNLTNVFFLCILQARMPLFNNHSRT